MGYRAKTIQNKASFPIMEVLIERPHFISEIAKKLKKDMFPIIEQLKELKKEGIIFEYGHPERRYNKKYISLTEKGIKIYSISKRYFKITNEYNKQIKEIEMEFNKLK